jgi:hypothetical protein
LSVLGDRVLKVSFNASATPLVMGRGIVGIARQALLLAECRLQIQFPA